MTEDLSFAQQAELEKDAFVNFRRKFALEYPQPVSPTATLAGSLSWEFWTSIVVGFAAMLLAGMRTYGKFHEISVRSFGDTFAATFEAVISIVAIEGVMFIAEAIRASKDVSDVGKTEFLGSLKMIGWLTLGVSIAAGIGQSVPSLSGLPAFVSVWSDWAILLGLGAGASVIAKVAGGIVGSQIAEAKGMLSRFSADFDLEMSTWKSTMQEAWEKSDDRAIAREGLRIASMGARQSVKNARIVPVRSFAPSNERAPSEVAEKILGYLRQTCNADIVPGSGLAGPSHVADLLVVSKSYASKIINEYAANEYPFKSRAMLEANAAE